MNHNSAKCKKNTERNCTKQAVGEENEPAARRWLHTGKMKTTAVRWIGRTDFDAALLRYDELIRSQQREPSRGLIGERIAQRRRQRDATRMLILWRRKASGHGPA